MKNLTNVLACAVILLFLVGCSRSSDDAASSGTHTHADGTVHSNDAPEESPSHEGTHTHADGTVHGDHSGDESTQAGHGDHDEVSLGTAMIGDLKAEFGQGHGAVSAGTEGHLVVKLPYSDNGATVVRAWIGTEDRTMSYVGKGVYAPSHDDYDIHAMAPKPLPANAMWWVEVEKPDGTKLLGSVKPISE